MKKLIIALAAVAAASLTQAAQVVWNSGDLADYVTDDITSITGYYYTIGASDTVDVNDYVNADGSLKAAADGQSSTVVIGPDTDIVQVNMTQTTDSNPAYAALVYIAKSAYGGSYAVATKAVYEVDSETGYETDNNTASGAMADYMDTHGGASSWTAVPEPTTVALLALGLAAVGLKRKVA